MHDFFCDVFFWRRGCVILFVKSLRDFVCGEVASFLCFCLWKLRDFFCGEVTWFFVCKGCMLFLWRGSMIFFGGEVGRLKRKGCVIFSMERLHDFCVWRGCVIFLTHWLTQVAWFIFFLEVAWLSFCGEVVWFLLLRDCVVFFVKRFLDFFCEEVEWCLCEEVFY